MKKIFITILSILVVALVLIILITNLSSRKHNKEIISVEKTFLKTNKDIEILETSIYYGDKTYYIINYKKSNNNYISVHDGKTDIFTTEENKLYKLNKESTIGYKYDKLIYEIKKESKDGFTYSYYDALSGEFIKKIKLNK